jgi:hypothetical protein
VTEKLAHLTSSPEGDWWGHETAEGCFFFCDDARLLATWWSVLNVAKRAEKVSMDKSKPGMVDMLM